MLSSSTSTKKKPRRTLSHQTVKFLDELTNKQSHENVFPLYKNATISRLDKRSSLLAPHSSLLPSSTDEANGRIGRRYSVDYYFYFSSLWIQLTVFYFLNVSSFLTRTHKIHEKLKQKILLNVLLVVILRLFVIILLLILFLKLLKLTS